MVTVGLRRVVLVAVLSALAAHVVLADPADQQWKVHSVADAMDSIVLGGRWDTSNLKAAEPHLAADWSYTWFEFGVTGTSMVAVDMGGHGNFLSVYVDGRQTVLETKDPWFKKSERYVLAENLSPSEKHTVRVVKRTEAMAAAGLVNFKFKMELFAIATGPSGAMFRPETTVPTRKILFIGDSDTAAFGVEGPDSTCFDLKYEDSEASFAVLLGQHFNAEPHLVCISGFGVARNAQDVVSWGTSKTMVDYARRTLATGDATWNPAQWPADAVVVRLGANDYMFPPAPSDEAFKAKYHQLLSEVLEDYPTAMVVNLCGDPVDAKHPLCALTKEVVAQFSDLKKPDGSLQVTYIDVPWKIITEADKGCIDHWNVGGHKKIVASIVGPMAEALGWKPTLPAEEESLTPVVV